MKPCVVHTTKWRFSQVKCVYSCPPHFIFYYYFIIYIPNLYLEVLDTQHTCQLRHLHERKIVSLKIYGEKGTLRLNTIKNIKVLDNE